MKDANMDSLILTLRDIDRRPTGGPFIPKHSYGTIISTCDLDGSVVADIEGGYGYRRISRNDYTIHKEHNNGHRPNAH
jgi:hypothetical protein